MFLLMKVACVLDDLFFGWLVAGLCRHSVRKVQKAQPDLWIPTRQCMSCWRYTFSYGQYCFHCGSNQWPETDPLLESTMKRASLLKITSK